jgi:hypothetical protein
MKVKELKRLLKECDNNDEVVIAKDEEGNSFSPLSEIQTNAVYVPSSKYSGEVYLREITGNLEVAGYLEEDLYHGKNGQNAVVLWPTN